MKKVNLLAMIITKETLLNYEQRYRTHLVNSLNGFKSANLIGTKSKDGQSNLAIFSSVIHLGSNPPMLGFITRPDSVPRHTLENIKETHSYTINHINSAIIKEAHQTSSRYDRDISEFEATGLKETYMDDFQAPFVDESNVKIGMKLKEIIPIPSNGTLLVIGEIQIISIPDETILKDGKLDLVKADTVTISGLDTYHSTSELMRLSYAKPNKVIEVLS